MNSYSNEELVDMLIVYGDADCNGHSLRKLNLEHYPNRRASHHTIFASVNRRFVFDLIITNASVCDVTFFVTEAMISVLKLYDATKALKVSDETFPGNHLISGLQTCL
ncbi:hypothetical protein TNCV_3968721 [Trichonephila clavipes]|nr:hypothetical protein TNCV_3968721 [Trichonephila clavipes]